MVTVANLTLRLEIQLQGSFSLTFRPPILQFLSSDTMCFCTICREVTYTSASNPRKQNSKRRSQENENFNGDFLTLAPPSPTSYQPPKSKPSSTLLAFQNENQVCPEFEFLPPILVYSWLILAFHLVKGNVEEQIPASPVYRLFNQQKQPVYGFFHQEPKEEQIGHTAARIQNGHEVGENVDLNLKLWIEELLG